MNAFDLVCSGGCCHNGQQSAHDSFDRSTKEKNLNFFNPFLTHGPQFHSGFYWSRLTVCCYQSGSRMQLPPKASFCTQELTGCSVEVPSFLPQWASIVKFYLNLPHKKSQLFGLSTMIYCEASLRKISNLFSSKTINKTCALCFSGNIPTQSVANWLNKCGERMRATWCYKKRLNIMIQTGVSQTIHVKWGYVCVNNHNVGLELLGWTDPTNTQFSVEQHRLQFCNHMNSFCFSFKLEFCC